MDSTSPAHIILIGFMGSGKSSVARMLAAKTGLRLLETDELVVREAGCSVADIFAKEGEDGFRSRERAVLKALSSQEQSVVSCGGGVVVRAQNRSLLAELGTIVYLEVSAEESLARVGQDDNRPLLRGSIAPHQLLEQRRGWYEEIADIRVDTSAKGVAQVADEVYQRLSELKVI